MEQKSQVLEVEVEHQGQIHRASYFVEGDVVHARIGGKVLRSPLGSGNAADTVRTLLAGHLLLQTRKTQNAKLWRDSTP